MRPTRREISSLFRPHYAQWWMGLKNESTPYIASEVFLATRGTDLDWTAMLLFAMVRSKLFEKPAEDTDLFGINCKGSIHDQAVNAAIQWQNHQDIEELVGTSEDFLHSYDVYRRQFDKYMENILTKLDGKPNEELPTIPVKPPVEPVKPQPVDSQEPKPEEPKPEEPKPPTNKKLIVGILSLIATVGGTIAALTPIPWDDMLVKAVKLILQFIGG